MYPLHTQTNVTEKRHHFSWCLLIKAKRKSSRNFDVVTSLLVFQSLNLTFYFLTEGEFLKTIEVFTVRVFFRATGDLWC